MIKNKPRVETIRQLNLYTPTNEKSKFTLKISVKYSQHSHKYNKTTEHNFNKDIFYHFPIVINEDNSPWPDANRYLLSKLTNIITPKHRTLESIASDIVNYRRWLLEENIDYLYTSPRTRARPTYRYCSFLHNEIKAGKIKPQTAKRRMSSIQGFYRWLINDGHLFEHPLWVEDNTQIMFNNISGFKQSKTVISTDLTRSFKMTKNSDNYSKHINDGGKLRPLPIEEQKAIVESLLRIGNIEMLLAFLIALTTGARLQTVFTLRQQNFNQPLRNDNYNHKIKVGRGTLVNTKNEKQMVIMIPAWLYRKIKIYLQCDRYKKRLHLSKHTYKNNDEQYVFLTRYGQPYYMADNDEFSFIYRTPPRGNSITQFIRQQLKPDIKNNGLSFDFRFHDLRASFGMNLLEGKLKFNTHDIAGQHNNPDLFQILMYVRERMGHSLLSTTESYLNYRQHYHLAMHVQSEYEKYLKKITNAFGEQNDLD